MTRGHYSTSNNDPRSRFELAFPKDQLCLVMMKFRRAKDDIELSYMFEVCESTV